MVIKTFKTYKHDSDYLLISKRTLLAQMRAFELAINFLSFTTGKPLEELQFEFLSSAYELVLELDEPTLDETVKKLIETQNNS